jgi:hypothetical protein
MFSLLMKLELNLKSYPPKNAPKGESSCTPLLMEPSRTLKRIKQVYISSFTFQVVGLVGGIQSVIMGEKNLKKGEEKVQRKLEYKPLFDVVVEFKKEKRNEWTIHHDVEKLMTQMLSGKSYEVEIRTHDELSGTVETTTEMINS